MRALITGATGLVGGALLEHLPGAAILTRDPAGARNRRPSLDAFEWNPEAGTPPDEALVSKELIVHLAGEPIATGRFNKRKKQRIHDSRVVGTRHLVAALAASEHRPRLLVSASAVGFYGDRGDEWLDESSQPGTDFLASVCEGWEREALAARDLGIRVVCLRLGIVLSRSGGALGRMLTPFRLGLGGRLGSGQQWMPWIHLDDVVGLILHAAQSPALGGPINATAPEPVRNAEFTKQLARALGTRARIPVPQPALRLALGELADIVLASQRVRPKAALDDGYVFKYPDVAGALEQLVGTGE